MNVVRTTARVTTNSPGQVLFASLIGTTIEFFDFYIYATAAVLVFPTLFFPPTDPAAARLASLATFGIAFVARPIGSALFGHFGDRIGRKTTLVAALLTMGVSTVAIGLLPTYATIGVAAPAAARALPLRPGPRAGRRVGRGGAARHRERAARQARLVRHVSRSSARRSASSVSSGVFLLLSDRLTDDAVLLVRLADPVPGQRRSWWSSACTCA